MTLKITKRVIIMIKKINYEGRDLTKKETIQIQYLWQSFNPKNSKMLDDGYIVIDQAHIDQYSKSSTFDFKNSLDYYQESDYRCKKYTCDYKRTGLQITYKDNLSLNYINFNKFSVLGFQHPNNLQLSLQSPDTPRATCCPRNCKSG